MMLLPRPVAFGLFMLAMPLVLGACGGVASVEEAADSLDTPDEFVAVDAETLEGFEETQRVLTYSTNLSQTDACELGRAMLRDWAGQEIADAGTAMPLTVCRFELRNPSNHAGIDYAAVNIERKGVDGEFIEDNTQAGGVSRIVIVFAKDK